MKTLKYICKEAIKHGLELHSDDFYYYVKARLTTKINFGKI